MENDFGEARTRRKTQKYAASGIVFAVIAAGDLKSFEPPKQKRLAHMYCSALEAFHPSDMMIDEDLEDISTLWKER